MSQAQTKKPWYKRHLGASLSFLIPFTIIAIWMDCPGEYKDLLDDWGRERAQWGEQFEITSAIQFRAFYEALQLTLLYAIFAGLLGLTLYILVKLVIWLFSRILAAKS